MMNAAKLIPGTRVYIGASDDPTEVKIVSVTDTKITYGNEAMSDRSAPLDIGLALIDQGCRTHIKYLDSVIKSCNPGPGAALRNAVAVLCERAQKEADRLRALIA